jgi:hypothetical protein
MEIDEPPKEHWQTQHNTLGMNLYPLLEFAIKSSAKRSRALVENSVTLGNPNGLNVLHDLLRYHHPRVLDSIAPPFDIIYLNSPKIHKPEKGSTYNLTVDDYKAKCNEWELSISMYPEVQNLRRSHHALKQLQQGILPALKSHVLHIENHVTRHYQRHRFELHSIAEAMTILKAAAHTLNQQTGLSFHGPLNVANLSLDDFPEIQHPLFESPQMDWTNLPTIVCTQWMPHRPNQWFLTLNNFKIVVERQDPRNHVNMPPALEHTHSTNVISAETLTLLPAVGTCVRSP